MGSFVLLSSTRLRTLSRNQFLILRSVMKGGELGEDMLEVRFALDFRVCFAQYSESSDEALGASQVSRIHTPKTRQSDL